MTGVSKCGNANVKVTPAIKKQFRYVITLSGGVHNCPAGAEGRRVKATVTVVTTAFGANSKRALSI